KEFLKDRTAFFLAVSFLFTLGNIAYVFHLLTENIYLFFILAAFYGLMRYYKTNRFSWLAFAVGLLILSMLIRPGSMFLGIIACLFFCKEIIANYKSKAAFFIYGSIG